MSIYFVDEYLDSYYTCIVRVEDQIVFFYNGVKSIFQIEEEGIGIDAPTEDDDIPLSGATIAEAKPVGE